MQEKHLAVISPQLCDALYNADLLRVASGSQLKSFSTDFWPKIITQLFNHEFKATDCIILFFLFMEARRRKSPLSILCDGELEAWMISHQELFQVSPKSPLQGSFPSTASCSSLPICRGLTPHSNNLQD